jgi:uncharacterized protein (DUF885 family)
VRAPSLALTLILAALPAAGASPSPAAERALAVLLADYDAFDRLVDPLTAGNDGDAEALARLPDGSPEAIAGQRRALEGFSRRLTALPAAALSGESAVNRAVLAEQVAQALEAIRLDLARLNLDAYGGFHLFPTQLAQQTRVGSKAEAQAYLRRLERLPRYLETELANARRGVATGFVQPRPVMEVVRRVVEQQLARPPTEDPLLEPLRELPPELPAEVQAAVRARALELVTAQVRPRQVALLTFLTDEYLPHAREGLAARDLPGGEAFYAWAVRSHTTTRLTPEEVHALGLREVARVRAAMEVAMRDAGFTGTFAEFQRLLRNDPRFYVTSREALLEKAALFAKRVDDVLPRAFGVLPRLGFAIREIPRESEEGATTAYAQWGSAALGIAFGFMVNTSHLDQRPLYELPALALHESAPGHTFQGALAQEQTGLPRFRRNAYVTAYVEGWALYAEELGVELGLYKTPEERFGKLSYEMWRACRLVADTGLHWLRWSKDEARRCFAENTALAPHNIEVELDRYIGWPGQALAYTIGKLELVRLRRRAEAELGPRFSLPAFHDAVLLGGPLPLEALAGRVEAFIAARKRAGR